MTRSELLELVQTIFGKQQSLSEEQFVELVEKFVGEIPHPGGSDLIFYPDIWGLSSKPTPEGIVDVALSWKPKTLVMLITDIRRHPRRKDLTCYEVFLDGVCRTQVVSKKSLEVGDHCAVAFSGVELPNGKGVVHRFVDRAFSVGEILGVTSDSLGQEVRLDDFYTADLPTV